MKKYLKLIICNTLLLAFLLILLEFFSLFIAYGIDYTRFLHLHNDTKKSTIENHINNIIYYFKSALNPNNEYFKDNEFRKESNFYNSTNIVDSKSPIIVMGCSYTYGDYLNNNETFSAILSKNTKRTVFNLGLSGGSPREMLYILRNSQIRNERLKNNKNFEYVIYTYITDHRYSRLYTNLRNVSPNFRKTKNNTLEYHKILYNSYTRRLFTQMIIKYSSSHNKNSANLFYTYMSEINKEIHKHFNNNGEVSKFVILVYEQDSNIDWKALEKQGIIVINLKEIVDVDLFTHEKYTLDDKFHPNAEAWNLIVPSLAKKLNL